MNAELKQGNARPSFYGTFNVVVTSNEELRVKVNGDADAWKRRLLIIPWKKRERRQRIANYEERLLEAEGPGIVRRALAELEELLFDHDIFPMSTGQLRRVDECLNMSNPVMEFVLDHVELFEGGSILKADLKQEFKEYCKARRKFIAGEREIGGQLEKAIESAFGVSESNSLVNSHGKCAQGYRGIGWKAD